MILSKEREREIISMMRIIWDKQIDFSGVTLLNYQNFFFFCVLM